MREVLTGVVERWPAARWPLTAGAVSIVAGGLVAAATRPLGFEAGSWVAAFLVLVGGVAQIGLGAGRVHLCAVPPSERDAQVDVALWGVAAALTVAGSLLGAPALSTVGAVVLATELVGVWRAVRRSSRSPRLLWMVHVVVSVVMVSVPIGLVLAWARHS